MDSWISKWISGFQSGFLDFKVDWTSKWISGFQADFWISKRISGFHLNQCYSEEQLNYTYDTLTVFLSAYWLTEYKVTGTSPLHSAQAACSLSYIYIRILCVHCHAYSHTVVFVDHTYSACSLTHT